MSVDLTVVSLQRPDLDVCDRLARLALSSIDPPVDLASVSALEAASGYHEFGDRHVITLEALTREPGTYVAMLVLAQAIAWLYVGEVVDDSSFFPIVSTPDLFQRCLGPGLVTAEDLWVALRKADR